MRVTGGQLGGRRLNAPRGADTRPTADRVRESLFSILGPPAPGCRVLDLFAGAGTLAIEALSRGASAAVLVESGRPALAVLRANLAALDLAERAEVVAAPAQGALRRLIREGRRFNWVFLDPPYASEHGPRALATLGEGPLLAPGATVVIEHDRRRRPAAEVGCLVRIDDRRYGDTELSLYRPRSDETP